MTHALAPTKAVIMARGLGTRMRAPDAAAQLTEDQAKVAASGVKAMIDVGRPFMDYLLSSLADAGFTEVCLVIGPEHDAVREYVCSLPASRLKVTTAIQAEPKGTADAVAAAESFAAGDRILVLNSDNYYPAEVLAALREAPGSATVGFDRQALIAGSNIPAERISAFALMRTDSNRLTHIIEKPAPHDLARYGATAAVSMNCWLFTPAIFDACRRVQPSPRGELEIVDAVRLALAGGEVFTVVPAAAGILDIGSRGDIAAVAAALANVEVSL
ncbi:sugar phosphate nucleotidyltransferase [Devriesea agamarum]|uniref:sugar phosphate nucleotidyltransferase n=1 Tax=Devriesea agamarum TaxID=472569 RepID=UPI001E2E4261|nr:sugar phosphate nucleotidyltransferase [Devriesea agamarum]